LCLPERKNDALQSGAELHGGLGGPRTTMCSAHLRPIQIGNLDAAAHASYFVVSVFLQPILSSSAEGATLRILLPAAPFRSLFFTTTHSSSDGPVAGVGRVDKQACSTCECSAVCLKIFFRLPYLFSRHVSIFSFKSLRRATELEMHDASRICCLLVAVISNASSIC